MNTYKDRLLDDVYKKPKDTFAWLIPIAKAGRKKDNRGELKKALHKKYKFNPHRNVNQAKKVKGNITDTELNEIYILLTQGTVNLDIVEMAEMLKSLRGMKKVDAKVWVT